MLSGLIFPASFPGIVNRHPSFSVPPSLVERASFFELHDVAADALVEQLSDLVLYLDQLRLSLAALDDALLRDENCAQT